MRERSREGSTENMKLDKKILKRELTPTKVRSDFISPFARLAVADTKGLVSYCCCCPCC